MTNVNGTQIDLDEIPANLRRSPTEFLQNRASKALPAAPATPNPPKAEKAKTEPAHKPAEKAKGATKAKSKGKTAAKPKTAKGGRQPAATAPSKAKTGSKLEMIGNLLKRKSGCTAKDVLAATGWPAVSMPQQARALKIRLRTEKEGRTTRYFAA